MLDKTKKKYVFNYEKLRVSSSRNILIKKLKTTVQYQHIFDMVFTTYMFYYTSAN